MIELFMSDIHYPYEDRSAMKVAMNLVKDIKPDLIYLGGDILDFYTVSSFSKNPLKKMDWKKDKKYSVKRLTELREAAPNAQIDWQDGNHETRLMRYLTQNAEALFEEENLTIPKLFNFKELDIRYISGPCYKVGKLLHIHGDNPKVSGVYPAKTILDKLNTSFIMGHHHKVQHYAHRVFGNIVHGAWANGCLSSLHPDFDLFPQWEQSVSVIQYTKSGLFNVDQVIIIDSKLAVYNNKLYTTTGVNKL